MYNGIDVSTLQGDIRWFAAKATGKVDFAYIKFAQGKSDYNKRINYFFMDSRALNNIRDANKAGVKVGLYYYLTAADEQEANEEIDKLLADMSRYKLEYTLPLAIDAESVHMPLGNPKKYAQVVEAAARRFHELTGENVMIYTTRWYSLQIKAYSDLLSCDWVYWWIARPNAEYPTEGEITQHGVGYIPGVPFRVDLDFAEELPIK